ncbi:hypothetical protein, conserved [Eimeria praecox]|uniref:Phosphatidylethanolamine-binding protein n=1 Tax=Eimeria praecox TaxID=51316 RepID=U6G8F6_9EIME|nr:hypothetical protein, conserved [Eimeria praecox]
MVAIIAVSVFLACATSISAVAVRPLGVAHSHWGRLEAFPASPGRQPSAEAAPEEEESAEEADALATEGSEAQGAYGQAYNDADGWNMALLEEQLNEPALLGKAAMVDAISCSVSFSDGYGASPVVEVQGEGANQSTATAVFIDESARAWLHGFKSKISIPSSFRFETDGTDGDYADIHPPPGSGSHKYTVVLFKGTLHPGPLLSSLRGTPWRNRRRAVGSLGAIVADLRQQNPGKPVEELCRCSVHVSYEDIAQ